MALTYQEICDSADDQQSWKVPEFFLEQSSDWNFDMLTLRYPMELQQLRLIAQKQ